MIILRMILQGVKERESLEYAILIIILPRSCVRLGAGLDLNSQEQLRIERGM